ADALKRQKDQDMIGEGYSVFLPLKPYDPNVKKIRLLVAYLPKKGEPQLGDESIIAIQSRDEAIAPVIREKTTVPGVMPSDSPPNLLPKSNFVPPAPQPLPYNPPPNMGTPRQQSYVPQSQPLNNQPISLQQGTRVSLPVTQQQSNGLPGG